MKPLADTAYILRKDEVAPLKYEDLKRLWDNANQLYFLTARLDSWLSRRVEQELWDHVATAIQEGLES